MNFLCIFNAFLSSLKVHTVLKSEREHSSTMQHLSKAQGGADVP